LPRKAVNRKVGYAGVLVQVNLNSKIMRTKAGIKQSVRELNLFVTIQRVKLLLDRRQL